MLSIVQYIIQDMTVLVALYYVSEALAEVLPINHCSFSEALAEV